MDAVLHVSSEKKGREKDREEKKVARKSSRLRRRTNRKKARKVIRLRRKNEKKGGAKEVISFAEKDEKYLWTLLDFLYSYSVCR